jgi:hypothetical protein
VEKVAAEFYKLLGQYCERPLAKAALILLEKLEHEHVSEIESFKESFAETVSLENA